MWIAFRFCIFVLWTQWTTCELLLSLGCELLSDFVYSFFEHNSHSFRVLATKVVNCFQILYIRSLNTIRCHFRSMHRLLWIAFRFCIFVLWTQWQSRYKLAERCCELLSDFVYSFFEHNYAFRLSFRLSVVNCFQILYIRSLNTIICSNSCRKLTLWIAFRFCIFVLWTQLVSCLFVTFTGCELLSDFVYSFFEHNIEASEALNSIVVNCFQILYIRSLNTIERC